MAETLTPSEFTKKCTDLQAKWSTRNKKFLEWYDQLKLVNKLAQENMESVVSNDDRTSFNLARHLLNSSIIAHRINNEGMTVEQITATAYLEQYIERRWFDQETRYRQQGKQGFLWTLTSWLLTTGWYSVFSMVEDERIYSEVWNPGEVFPQFSDDGLISVPHIYSLTPAQANRKVKLMDWKVKEPFKSNVTLYDLWEFDDAGQIVNGIVLGKEFVKPITVDARLNNLKNPRLPVFTAPAGGLPDMGTLDEGAWQEHFGEAIVATNEQLSKNYNKMLTYTQQLVRDSANPRWLELSQSESGILDKTDIFKRGAIFKGQPGDSVQALQSPPIPIELRQAVMDYQNMMQRGSFPWAMFGNAQQQLSYLAMANVASSSMQTISPYAEALKGLLTDIDNYQADMLVSGGMKPHGYKMEGKLPETFEFSVQLDIEIPGYLVQRATISRMLDPNFRLSTTTVMDRMFPEIKNGMKEMAKARKDSALSHPKVILADTIIAIQEQAVAMREAGDAEAASIYDKLAQSLTSEMSGQPATAPTGNPISTKMNEVAPPELTSPEAQNTVAGNESALNPLGGQNG